MIVETAWKLFAADGYESTSVDSIVAAAGISKGTFYHYFESKEELLDAVVEEMMTVAFELTQKAVREPGLTATERLNRFFAASRQWRFENVDLLRKVVEALYRDENSRLLHKATERSIQRTAPLLREIIDQGVEEGSFSTPDPEETACMILEMLRGAGKRIMEVYEHTSDQELSKACVQLAERFNVYSLMIERMLCAKRESLERIEPSIFERGMEAYRGISEKGEV